MTTEGAGVEKQLQVEKLLGDILRLMEFPARLDFKDATDGSLAVAVHFTGEVPVGVSAGKKSSLVDSLQFLLNKCINRPNTERRWVTLGVGGFPEPRAPRPPGTPAPEAAPSPAAVPAPPARTQNRPPPQQQPQRPARPAEVDEAKLEVAADPLVSALGKALAEKSARLGRVYAIAMMAPEDRTRVLQAAKDVKGVQARVEGEGHFRRLAFMPEKPAPMPKRNATVYPDDEDEAD